MGIFVHILSSRSENMNENIKLYQGDCLEVMDKLIADGVNVKYK